MCLGTGDGAKTDEFSEKFQTAFDPPPSFSENHIAVFFGKVDQKARPGGGSKTLVTVGQNHFLENKVVFNVDFRNVAKKSRHLDHTLQNSYL